MFTASPHRDGKWVSQSPPLAARRKWVSRSSPLQGEEKWVSRSFASATTRNREKPGGGQKVGVPILREDAGPLPRKCAKKSLRYRRKVGVPVFLRSRLAAAAGKKVGVPVVCHVTTGGRKVGVPVFLRSPLPRSGRRVITQLVHLPLLRILSSTD